MLIKMEATVGLETVKFKPSEKKEIKEQIIKLLTISFISIASLR